MTQGDELRVTAEEPLLSFSPGDELGPYKIVGPLGSGGMGEVYRARDDRLDRDVAIKVLPARLSKDPESLRRFEIEVKSVAALSHPNIVAVHDVGKHAGRIYAVTELLEGMTLRERLRDGELAQHKAIEYAAQTADGLAAAHDKGIVHRDIKPENLFLTREGRLKILDFGLARQLFSGPPPSDTTSPTAGRQTEVGAILGTVGYMSPEQVRAEDVDHRADIFALGAVLYEMLTGSRAFHATSTAEVVSAILREDPFQTSARKAPLPSGLERVVRACLEKSPAERYQSAREVSLVLRTLQDSGSVTSSALPLPRAIADARKPRFPWLAVALSALAAAAATWFLTPEPTEAPQPRFERLTFRRGNIQGARFAPDGRTVVFDARWASGRTELHSVRPESPESRSLGLEGALLRAVSSEEELALLLQPVRWYESTQGTLARVPFGGNAPRAVLERVQEADFAPGSSQLGLIRMSEGNQWQVVRPDGRVAYETPRRLGGLRIGPGGELAFFEYYELTGRAARLCVVDSDDRVHVLVENLEAGGLAWRSDEIWYAVNAASGETSLWAITLLNGPRLLLRTPGALRLHDVALDGRVLAAMVEGRAAIQLIREDASEGDLTWLDASWAADISGDGNSLLINEMGMGGGPDGAFYLRAVDGGAAVRIGEGRALSLSSDGRHVLATVPGASFDLQLVPTGAGASRRFTVRDMTEIYDGWLTPDGRVLISALGTVGGDCYYLVDPKDGSARPVTPDGYSNFTGEHPVSPDGRWVTASYGPFGDVRLEAVALDGGEQRPVPGFEQGDAVVSWTADGRGIYVLRRDELPAALLRIDLSTGRRHLERELMPMDEAGVTSIASVEMTPDGRTLAYNYARSVSELYAIVGLR